MPSLDSGPTRRGLLDLLLGTGTLATLAALVAPVFGYLAPLRKNPASGRELLDADGNPVDAASIEEGSGVVGRLGGRAVLVLRRGGRLFAFGAVCTHLGCIVHWDGGRGVIQCPCHGGRFDLQGDVVAGPPPEPLPQVDIATRAGRVRLA